MRVNFKNRIIIAFIAVTSLGITFTSCDPEDIIDQVTKITEKTKLYNYVSELMHDVYYWYKDIPKEINQVTSLDVYDYFEKHLVSQDRWSWMMTGEEYLNDNAGVSTSYGASYAQPIDHYEDYSIRVRYVFPNTPMSENGVKRGWELTHLNNVPVMDLVRNNTFNTEMAKTSNTFTFKDHNNTTKTFTTTSRVINTRSYFTKEVYTSNEFPGLTKPVGYFNYYTFNAHMLEDIDDAMAMFKSAGVKHLILDLRYNGGGDGRATQLLANYIAPASADGKLIAKREHNDKYSSMDNKTEYMTIVKRIAGSLDLERLYILGSKGTASASEVIINGFKPLMDVIQVGRTTYGKPNGMYVLSYPENNYTNPEYIFLPIAFFSVNINGEGHYLNGLEPDHSRPDDLYHEFGINEDWVKACLTHSATGSFPSLPPAGAQTKSLGEQYRIDNESDLKNYGRYTFEFPLK
ncbi:MAG: S41 family peptidase [Bacteroidales bacterium]|jgi:C-terminal processing protease CtpA/Prc|nr:S41 family peptidase [Bacteroidales bacterium]